MAKGLEEGFRESVGKGEAFIKEIEAKIVTFEAEKKKLMGDMGGLIGKETKELLNKGLKNVEIMLFALKKIRFTGNEALEKNKGMFFAPFQFFSIILL